MENKIVFTPVEYFPEQILQHIPGPLYGSKVLPEWFKNIPRYQNDAKEMESAENGYHNLTVKHCMPFLDSIMSGYFLTTWTDIYVERKNGIPNIVYKDKDIAQLISTQIQYQENFPSNIPTLKGHDPFSYVWFKYWRIKTPPGVSCLFTHPMNRPELPFTTLSGITDTDKWNGSDVLNFAFHENFEGFIPKGTPYIQIIPFRRDQWTHEINSDIDLDMKTLREEVIQKRINKQSGHYRDNIWEKKSYK